MAPVFNDLRLVITVPLVGCTYRLQAPFQFHGNDSSHSAFCTRNDHRAFSVIRPSQSPTFEMKTGTGSMKPNNWHISAAFKQMLKLAPSIGDIIKKKSFGTPKTIPKTRDTRDNNSIQLPRIIAMSENAIDCFRKTQQYQKH